MVDTNVVIDILRAQPEWLAWSLNRLSEARNAGGVAVSSIVVAELASRESPAPLYAALKDLGLAVHDFGVEAGFRAGCAHRQYREAGGLRERLLGDFLIGAHAEIAVAPLLTRDPHRYRSYFPDLTLITPETDV